MSGSKILLKCATQRMIGSEMQPTKKKENDARLSVVFFQEK